MSDNLVKRCRDAFDSGDIPQKNITLRIAHDALKAKDAEIERLRALTIPKLFTEAEWSEDDGDVLWWRFPIVEPPYVGSPLDLGKPIGVTIGGKEFVYQDGGWREDYYTHWTRIPVPEQPR